MNNYNKVFTVSLRLTAFQLEKLEKLVELANKGKYWQNETKSSVILSLILKEYDNKVPGQM